VSDSKFEVELRGRTLSETGPSINLRIVTRGSHETDPYAIRREANPLLHDDAISCDPLAKENPVLNLGIYPIAGADGIRGSW
jgi:hypothetical protein